MNFAANFSSFFDKGKTFRPKKKFQPGTLKYSLHKQAQASLNSGINLRSVSEKKIMKIKVQLFLDSHGLFTSSSAPWLQTNFYVTKIRGHRSQRFHVSWFKQINEN